MLYVQFIHSIFIILSVVLGFFTIPHAQISGFYWRQVFTPQTINASLGGLLLGMLSPILIVILVHLIDFFSTVILKYIPGGAQRFVRVIVYIIVIALVI
ncbi:hypothetical protein EQ500_15115, partial [Lactobacillus sp. XV13L]|nr:hypothetical protein [Lactobacillus sp. XV13L]